MSILACSFSCTNLINGDDYANYIEIKEFYCYNSYFNHSGLLRNIATQQRTKLIMVGLDIDNLKIDSGLGLAPFMIENLYSVILNKIIITNLVSQTSILQITNTSILHLSDLKLQNISVFSNTPRSQLFVFDEIDVIVINNSHFQEIEINQILITIFSANASILRINNFTVIDLIASKFLAFQCYDIIEMQSINLSMKQSQIINTPNSDLIHSIVIKAQQIQIMNSIFQFIQGTMIIGSNILQITQTKFINDFQLLILNIRSSFSLVKNSIFLNVVIIQHSLIQDGRLHFYNNYLSTHIQNATNFQKNFIGIISMHVRIINNTLIFWNSGVFLHISADEHQITLINNTFITTDQYIFLGVFTDKTEILINQTTISPLQTDPVTKMISCILCLNIRVIDAKSLIIENLFVTNLTCSQFFLKNVSKVLLKKIYLKDVIALYDQITVVACPSIEIQNLYFKRLQNIRTCGMAVLIKINSEIDESLVLMKNITFFQVNSTSLIAISTNKYKQNITIKGLHMIKNLCDYPCLVSQDKLVNSKTIFRLLNIVSKNNLAKYIISFHTGVNADILFMNILVDEKDQDDFINFASKGKYGMSNYEIYQQFTQSNIFQNLFTVLYQTYQKRILVSFNNGNYFQKSVVQDDDISTAFVQFMGRAPKTYLYVPPYGYSFTNYSIFMKNQQKYQEYKLNMKFFTNNRKDSTKCILAYSSIMINFLINSQDFTDFTINYYDQSLIQFNITCYYSRPLQLIFYGKQLRCQRGEINMTNQCMPCQKELDQYSLQKTDRLCKVRDHFMMKQVEMSLIDIRDGFWRSEFYTDRIEVCLIWLDSCNGGLFYGDKSCKTGYIGATCFECDIENQYYKQIDGTCDKSRYIGVYLLIWTFISLIVLKISIQSHEEYWQARKRFLILYKKFGFIVHYEKLNIYFVSIVILAEYQQLSNLLLDRYTNQTNKIYSLLQFISYSDNYLFLALEAVFKQYYGASWIYYKLLFFLAQCSLVFSIYLFYYLIQWKYTNKAFKFLTIIKMIFYLTQMNIFIYFKQFIQLLTPFTLSNDRYMYNQLDLVYSTHITTVIIVFSLPILFLLIILLIIIRVAAQHRLIQQISLLIKQITYRLKKDSWIIFFRLSTLGTLIMINLLRQNSVYRIYLTIIYVTLATKFIQSSEIFINKINSKWEVLIFRVIAIQIVISSLINMVNHTIDYVIILDYSSTCIWILINLLLIISICRYRKFNEKNGLWLRLFKQSKSERKQKLQLIK